MRKTILLGILSLALFSCKSEYEERLDQAQALKIKIEHLEKMNEETNTVWYEDELDELHKEIAFLSKVSGNEQKFLEELYN